MMIHPFSLVEKPFPKFDKYDNMPFGFFFLMNNEYKSIHVHLKTVDMDCKERAVISHSNPFHQC